MYIENYVHVYISTMPELYIYPEYNLKHFWNVDYVLSTAYSAMYMYSGRSRCIT